MKKKLLLIGLCFGLFACNSGGGSNNSFTITAISPSTSTTIVPAQSFIATFSSNVNSNTLTNNITLISQTTLLPVAMSCSPATTSSVVCKPNANLQSGIKYNLNFGSGITNTAGVSLTPVTYSYMVN